MRVPSMPDRIPAAGLRWLTLAVVAVATACGSEPPSDPPATGAALIPTGPLGADVWIADLRWEASGPPAVAEPTNVTLRPGYDNQPQFVPDGSGFWYTAIDEHDGQADIWRYDFADEMVTRVTQTNPESEYSATPLPDGTGLSVVRVEADSTQRLWRVDPDGSNTAVLMADVAPVGYHAWADEHTLVMFVLGSPATLQRGDTRTGRASVLAENIGRSIQRIPDSNDVSFVQRHEDGAASVMRLPANGSSPETLIESVEGGDFHAWAPDGTLLMAHGSIVYGWTPGSGAGWQPIGDFSRLGITISRLAVSPDGSQIALVGEITP